MAIIISREALTYYVITNHPDFVEKGLGNALIAGFMSHYDRPQWGQDWTAFFDNHASGIRRSVIKLFQLSSRLH